MSPPTKTDRNTTTSAKTERKAFVPRPARSAEERLPRLYKALTDQVDEGHFANAIKTCKKILILSPSSTSAFQTLLFLHLHTDNYTAALHLLQTPSGQSLDFERAYCLYRLHREKEALEILAKLDKTRKVLHLEAQITYRLGEYERAQEVYEELLEGCDSVSLSLPLGKKLSDHPSKSSPEHPDILTNLQATSSHLTFISSTYHAQLSLPSHVSSEAELESYVPSLPTGWAGASTSAAPKKVVPAVKGDKIGKKRRHNLPKGAVEGKIQNQDPERWIPLKQRTTFVNAQSKKKGGKESMGTGFTQGSTSGGAPGGGGGSGGGAKGKKGKRH
ncbi:signal recognition particle subunit SRP72, partial [Tremellales sp. Uapishka_1]